MIRFGGKGIGVRLVFPPGCSPEVAPPGCGEASQKRGRWKVDMFFESESRWGGFFVSGGVGYDVA